MAIRLEPQSEVERARGDGLEVVRPVEPGRRIGARTNGQQSREALPRRHFSEPWNIRCSKRWANPVLPRLVARPHVDPRVDGHRRHRVIGRHDHPQAVVEGALMDRVVEAHADTLVDRHGRAQMI